MDVVDLHDPSRVAGRPDDVRVLLSGRFATLQPDMPAVTRVELRLYNEGTDDARGTYRLITSFVQTEEGSVEMVYDEGYLADNALARAAGLLTGGLGMSGLVLRSVISLRGGR